MHVLGYLPGLLLIKPGSQGQGCQPGRHVTWLPAQGVDRVLPAKTFQERCV